MNIELIRKWIDDLRYGGHKQIQKVLHDDEGYCCLGRAIEVIHGPDKWVIVEGDDDTYERVTFSYAYPWDTGYPCEDWWQTLPEEDLKTMGFEEIGLDVADLIRMNDGGVSFAAIADYIEKRLESYLCKENMEACK